MTNDAQKLVLLEWAGWKPEPHEWFKNPKGMMTKNPPNLSSLDVIAEFEQKLSPTLAAYYVGFIQEMTTDVFEQITLSAPQRLEALVRTLGLWKE